MLRLTFIQHYSIVVSKCFLLRYISIKQCMWYWDIYFTFHMTSFILLDTIYEWSYIYCLLIFACFIQYSLFCIVYIHIYIYSYRKLARVGFQFALGANFVQLLQFHCLFSVIFHFCYCLHQLPRSFSSNFFVEIITWV